MGVDSAVALVSLAQAKAFLKTTGTSEDTFLEFLVNRASKLAASYCGRSFVSASRTEYHDGDEQDLLLLIVYPVASVASIYDDPTRVFGADTLVATTDYIVEEEGGMVRLWNQKSRFFKGRGNVKVTYTAGYTAGSDVPADLEHAVLLILMYMYKRQYQDQKIGISSESIGDRNTTFENVDVPKAAAKILDNYRVVNNPSHAY